MTELSLPDKVPETSEESPLKLEKRRYSKAWFGKRKDSLEDVSDEKIRLPFQFYRALQNLRRKKSVQWRPRTIFHKKWGPMLSYEPRKLIASSEGKRLSPFGLSHSNENTKRLSPFGLSHSNKNVESEEEPGNVVRQWNVKDLQSKLAKNERDLKRFSSSFARYI